MEGTVGWWAGISQGGLRMTDFEIMTKALKIAWIKRKTEHVHPT